MKRTKNLRGYEALELFLIAVAVAIVGFTVWFVDHSKQMANADYAATAPLVSTTKTTRSTPNVIENQQAGSADLVAFLKADDTGCWRNGQNDRGWYSIVKEVNANQATLENGCAKTYANGNGTPDRILAHKVNGTWQLISPTNQWDYTIPSCTMLQANHILATLEPVCWSKQTASGTTVVPNQISQYATNYATCAVADGSRVTKAPNGFCVTKDHVIFARGY